MSHFAQLADSWWDVQGPQRILHKMNLLRMDYIDSVLSKYSVKQPGYSPEILPEGVAKAPLDTYTDMKVLDVGCGGGILAESLARLPRVSSVKGIDLTPEVIEVAKQHMKRDPVLGPKLTYHLQELDSVSEQDFDVVTMFEVLEHVDRPALMLRSALDRTKPGGWVFLSTINRTPIAYFTTIFMGEDVLRIVPKGTHTYEKYINESELREWLLDQSDVEYVQSDGCIYVPTKGWILTLNCSIGNYFMAVRKKSN
ncbi:ubiquinone biosynthesis O-methyltransferase, mitochondrial [Trichomonascus vanleenenianus]|uniref:hexaprenyldihydroxybenzoate methyltransferase n=1 Tax=Trichomonascus vanleenenianus TaxID=2268995 RepID=UPI003ECAEEAD